MKRIRIFFPVLFILLVLFLTGCIKIDTSGFTNDSENMGSGAITSEAVLPGNNDELTSLEAAALAYSEALKWREDAILWYSLPVAVYLNEDWENTDTSWEWAILFVCGNAEIRYNVTIEGSKIISAVEEDVARICDIKNEFPADRPGISMKEAAVTALANNMPSHIMPFIVYTIENPNKKYNGRATWEFAFSLDGIYYRYYIDGLNGNLIEITGDDGNPIEPPAVRTQTVPTLNARESAEYFISLLDSGKTNEALDMLPVYQTENETNKNMWSDSFSAIDSISIISTEESFKDEWNSIREYYKYTLDVKLISGTQPGLWEDGKIIRWFNMVLDDGQWKVSEISMNP